MEEQVGAGGLATGVPPVRGWVSKQVVESRMLMMRAMFQISRLVFLNIYSPVSGPE